MAFFKRRIKDEELLRIKHDVEKALSEAQKALDTTNKSHHVYTDYTRGGLAGGGHISDADARERDREEREVFLNLRHTFLEISAQLQAYIDSMWGGKRKR